MALSRARPAEVPADAVIITEDQALKYQWKIVTTWEKRSEVWALRYGPGITSALAAATGAYINNHYRTKLRLGSNGRFSSYLPIVVVPAMFTMLTHKFFIQRPILINPLAECPACIQVRAAALQSSLGVIYPAILAPFAAFMFATRCYTYRLPSILEKPKEVFQLWVKFTRPIVPALGVIIAVQALLTMYVTGKEATQNFNLLLRMKEIEHEVESSLQSEIINS